MNLSGLKAVTLHRPWSYAVVHLGKPIENRSWNCPLKAGDPIAIHAGKKWDKDAADWIAAQGLGTVPPEQEHPQGIVAIATFEGNVTQSDSPWFLGEIGWKLGNIRPLPQPVACKGQQGIWTPTRATVEAVEAQLTTQPQLPDWIAKRPRHLPLIAYHALNATLVEFKHPQTRIIPREDGLYLHHVEMGSVENLSGYRLATPDDLSTAQFFLSAGGMVFQVSTDGNTVTLDHPDGTRKVRLPSAEDVEFDRVVHRFASVFGGVIVADEEEAA